MSLIEDTNYNNIDLPSDSPKIKKCQKPHKWEHVDNVDQHSLITKHFFRLNTGTYIPYWFYFFLCFLFML